jgi:hypothetical protein
MNYELSKRLTEIEARLSQMERLVMKPSTPVACAVCYDTAMEVSNYDYRTGRIDWKCPDCEKAKFLH